MRPVKCFVVGCARSGTTLLAVLLDRSSQLAMPPETGFYLEIAPQMQNSVPLPQILAAWPRLPELGLDVETVMAACGERPTPGLLLATILSLHADLRDKPYCGEKTPQHWRHIDSLLDDFPDTRVIFAVRDGRDAALSLASMPWWPHDLRRATSVWLGAAQVARASIASHPGRVTIMRYEDLVASPRETLCRIMDSIGLPFEDRQLNGDVRSGVVLPRSMPWKGRSLETVDQSRVGHWRVTATPDQAAYLKKELAQELAHFGYEV